MPLKLAVRERDAAALDVPLLVVALPKPAELPAELRALDDQLGGALGRTIGRRDFRGDRDETLHLSGGA